MLFELRGPTREVSRGQNRPAPSPAKLARAPAFSLASLGFQSHKMGPTTPSQGRRVPLPLT